MLNLTLATYAQGKQALLFSDVISDNLENYVQSCQQAVRDKDYEQLPLLFNTLVQDHLKGTKLDELRMELLDGGVMDFSKLERPVLLTTTASWYIKNDEEIEAINTLASEFAGKIDVVVLFWDSKRTVKVLSKKYHDKVKIVYVDESLNINNEIINTYKHALGIPATFYISSERKIVDINRGGLVKFNTERQEELYAANYHTFHKHIVKLLLKEQLLDNTILTDTD
ncbi:MAG: TlpA family protein disulfide reductase [Flavobacteriaceae bacterium]|nr:TlpA family protein disulfide reductase [Bacteroidia bacterium]NNK87435.1 TlpA family protein disulfide reductase [Flavobacteriaceae bacterium]